MSALTTGRCVHSAVETEIATRQEKTENRREDGTLISRSYKSVPDHRVTGDVEIWVDFAALLRQKATRAMLSKSGTAQLAFGAIVIKAKNRRKLPL